MVGVEEARHVEIGADILDDDVGRVAPAADGDVAIGQGEAFERGRVGAADDLDAGPRRVAERGGVDRIRRGRGRRGASARGAAGPPPSGRRAASARPPVRPCRCRATLRSRATGEGDSRRSSRAVRDASASAVARALARLRRARRAQPETAGGRRWRQGGDRLAAAKGQFGQIFTPLRWVEGCVSGSTIRQLPSTPVMRTRSPARPGRRGRSIRCRRPGPGRHARRRPRPRSRFSDQPRGAVVEQRIAAVDVPVGVDLRPIITATTA